MEPVLLDLQNFLSYRRETVDLSPITCAALVGENGAGKSSLLDALTWALFGQGTRGGTKELDNYVTRGEKEARVEVQFRLNGAIYKVVRGRSIARNKSTLEFFILDGENWRPLSGKTLAETQKVIEETLRMDYRTFTASALVLQGQADAFTANMTDQERKEALARILGLDLWDRMQERAREKVRQFKAEVQALELNRKRLMDLVSEKDGLVSRQAAINQELGTLAAQVEDISSKATDLEAKLKQKPVLEQTLADTRRAMQKALAEIQANDQEITKARQQIAQAEQQIKAAETILARREEIEAAVEMEAEIAQDVAEFDRQAQEYMKLQGEIAKLQQQEAAWNQKVAAEVARLEAQAESAAKQAGLLGSVPCSGEVKSSCPLLASARKASELLAQVKERLSRLKAQTNPYTQQRTKLEQTLVSLEYDQEAHKAARAALEDVRKTARLKAELDAAAEKVAMLTARIAELQEQIAALEQKNQALSAEVDNLKAREASIVQEIEALKPIVFELSQVQSQLNDLRRQEAALRTELGRIESSLEQVAKAEVELAEHEKKAQALKEELAVYEVLDQACGKKGGVPALVVENAVPEIERLANDILSRMAGGRLAVRLDTQAEGKTTGTMQEVLRITVLDGGIERPYQTYSGAERFMVDLALRVALSKFLAHRAGAEIKLFVLDEGLGACDQANRQAVMQAIQTVAQEFGKVLVITHIAELQDALPQRIEVTKGPDGSKVRIA